MNKWGRNFAVLLDVPDDDIASNPELPHVLVRVRRITDAKLLHEYRISCTCGWRHGGDGPTLTVYETVGDQLWEEHLIASREEAVRRAREIVCKFTGESP